MLKELEIINIQAHVYSYLEFHHHLNVIRGTSHHGKSSIIRSIRWALENEPYGINYLNWDKDEKEGFESHLSFDEGNISRVKNSKFNGYLLNASSLQEEEKLEALRSDVPDEIRAVSRMNRNNIRGQDDGYFMLQDSPGNVARMLNEKTGLDDIDKVNKITKNLLSEFKSKLKHTEKELEKHQSRRVYLLKIKSFEYQIHELDNMFERYDRTDNHIRILGDILAKLFNIHMKIRNCEAVLKRQAELDVIVNLLDRRIKAVAQYTKLKLSLNNINMLETNIEHILIELEMGPIINDINVLILEREQTLKDWENLYSRNNIIKILNRKIGAKEDHIYEIDRELSDLNDKLYNIEICTTCGAKREHWQIDLL